MNSYAYCSSRGRCLQDLQCAGVVVKPGVKLLKLFDIAKRDLRLVEGTRIVYFVCGIPDICTLLREEHPLYEESIINMNISTDSIVDTYKTNIETVYKGLRDIGCQAVFSTICTMNFENGTHHRLAKRKTTFLRHESQYLFMQDRLNSVFLILNRFITEFNSQHDICTPFLHSYVHQKCSSKIRYKYTKLVDGVHPAPDLGERWASHLWKVILDNESRVKN